VQHKENSRPPAGELAAQIVQEIGCEDSYTQVPNASVQKYYPFTGSVVESQGMWLSKESSKAGELCCFRLRSTADAQQAKKVIGSRLQRKAQAFLGVSRDQYQLVQQAAVVQKDRYLLVAVSGDPQAEIDIFQKLLK
jgi:hypothetical protein